jgi:hypothetical protein
VLPEQAVLLRSEISLSALQRRLPTLASDRRITAKASASPSRRRCWRGRIWSSSDPRRRPRYGFFSGCRTSGFLGFAAWRAKHSP